MTLAFRLAAVAILACSGAAQALTADELLAKNLEARGGAKALAAVQSMRTSGRYDDGSGADIRFTTLQVRPADIRNEIALQGMTLIVAYDGRDAWRISPFGGRKDPDKLTADDAKSLVYSADLDGPLVDPAGKGIKVEYLGVEDVDGTAAHKLKLTRPGGDVEYHWLDPDYFLEIRVLTQYLVRGVQEESETDLGDYEKVDGVMVPMSNASGPKGSANKATSTVEKVEINVPLDADSFHFPAAAKNRK